MKKALAMLVAVLFAFSATVSYAQTTEKKAPNPNQKAYERASDNARFKRGEDWKKGKGAQKEMKEGAGKTAKDVGKEAARAQKEAEKKASKEKKEAEKKAAKLQKEAEKQARKAEREQKREQKKAGKKAK